MLTTPYNPGTFYFSAPMSYDWTSPQNNGLWRDAYKTLFDPCPGGWQVPRSGAERLSPWANFSEEDVADVFNNGYSWPLTVSGQSGTVFYPASGVRYNDSGRFRYARQDGLYWSAYLYYYFRIAVKWVEPGAPNTPAHGFSVRCIRE